MKGIATTAIIILIVAGVAVIGLGAVLQNGNQGSETLGGILGGFRSEPKTQAQPKPPPEVRVTQKPVKIETFREPRVGCGDSAISGNTISLNCRDLTYVVYVADGNVVNPSSFKLNATYGTPTIMKYVCNDARTECMIYGKIANITTGSKAFTEKSGTDNSVELVVDDLRPLSVDFSETSTSGAVTKITDTVDYNGAIMVTDPNTGVTLVKEIEPVMTKMTDVVGKAVVTETVHNTYEKVASTSGGAMVRTGSSERVGYVGSALNGRTS